MDNSYSPTPPTGETFLLSNVMRMFALLIGADASPDGTLTEDHRQEIKKFVGEAYEAGIDVIAISEGAETHEPHEPFRNKTPSDVAGEAYQVIGSIGYATGSTETEYVQRALDYFSEMEGSPDDIVPFDITPNKRLALEELEAAITFYDKVKASSVDEQIAVGQDHFIRLDRAARAVVDV